MKALLLVLALVFSFQAFGSSGDNNNFRFSPIGLIVGAVNANVDFKISPNWTLGPEIGFWHFKLDATDGFTSNYDIKAFELGARANWFKNGTFTDGLYVGPSLTYASVKVETNDSTGAAVDADASLPILGCLVGYGWFWDSFNIMLGGGAQFALGDAKIAVKDSSGTTTEVNSEPAGGLALEFSLGWTF